MDLPEKLDVAIIGAGLSGICALIRVRQAFADANVIVPEKAAEVGGTWAKSTYPGLSYDIPSQILRYIRRVVFDYGCEDHSRTKQEFTGAKWLEEDLLWRILVRDTASGKDYAFANRPNEADAIQELKNFKGHILHSARWEHSLDLQDMDVLVIGNGCSANQFIPHLARKASIKHLTQVVRSAHWIAPKENQRVPGWQQRIWLAASLDLGFIAFQTSLIGKLVRGAVQRSLRTYMQRTAPARYHDILIPDFDFEAKRPVLGHGYLTVLHDPKVELVKSQALKVVGPNSIASDDGRIFQADVIVLANGFKTQELLTPMEIVGRDDAELPRSWKEEHCFTSAYMGVSIHGFPNLFLLTGPNTPPSGHSTLVGIECSVEYIIRLLKKLLGELSAPNNASLGLRADAQKAFNDRLQTRMNGLVYSAHAITDRLDW
ncbi:FAD/NAD(P)-binding domain-containing protein [Nemania sp. NC0429]|nr:FAD/NAD(P)-binding domain-containing protein [Nemania sp. NC0429]